VTENIASNFSPNLFSELMGTKQEGIDVANMLGVKPWLGKDAVARVCLKTHNQSKIEPI
jgi:hypothetical protein